MKRYHLERERIRREHRFHLRNVHKWPTQPVNCACELQAGRFRKKKALDCGKARCLLCHYEKIFGIPSHRDRVRQQRADDSTVDQFEILSNTKYLAASERDQR